MIDLTSHVIENITWQLDEMFSTDYLCDVFNLERDVSKYWKHHFIN